MVGDEAHSLRLKPSKSRESRAEELRFELNFGERTGPPCSQRTVGHGFPGADVLCGLL